MQNTLHNTVSGKLYLYDDQLISLIGEDVFNSTSDSSTISQDRTQIDSSTSLLHSPEIFQTNNFISFNGRKMDH